MDKNLSITPSVQVSRAPSTSSGTVSTISVATTNGFAGTVATPTTTPVITMKTTITGVIKGDGTAILAATVGTDYSVGTSALATGILKSTTTTGALSIATAGTDYTTPTGAENVSNKTVSSSIWTTSINSQIGTSYTLVLTDQSKLITCTNAGTITLTIPTNASVAFPVGTQIDLSQDGAGKLTVSPTGGVTLNSLGGLFSAAGQWVGLTLIKKATNTRTLYGNLIT